MARGCLGGFKKAENKTTGRKQLRREELEETWAERAKTLKGL
jgi:hypothetical protein